jgi:SAM-dependent methyltransferase
MALNPVMKAIRANELRPTRFHTERGDWMPARAWLAVPRAAWNRIRRRESECPWIVPAAVVFLETLMRNDWHVFEFGSGYSTAWFAERAERVISVEDDESWHRRVSSTLAATKNGAAEVRLVDSADHPGVIERFPDETFDLIVVDSSGDRLACLASAAAKVKRGGFLLLDDSDRECLRRADDLLPGWCPHRFVGLKARPLTAVETTIFQRPRDENMNKRAEGNGLESWNPPAGTRELYGHSSTSMWSLVEQASAQRVEVPYVTLDDLLAECSVGIPSLVKIDAEGAELDILRGGLHLATETRAVLVVEFTDAEVVEETRALLPGHASEALTDRHWLLRGPA